MIIEAFGRPASVRKVADAADEAVVTGFGDLCADVVVFGPFGIARITLCRAAGGARNM